MESLISAFTCIVMICAVFMAFFYQLGRKHGYEQTDQYTTGYWQGFDKGYNTGLKDVR